MKTEQKSFEARSVLIGAALGAVVMFSVAASTDKIRKATWEYKTVAEHAHGDELARAINAETAQGWEFVSAHPSGERWGFAVLRREKK